MRSGDTQSSPTANPDVRITVYGDTYASVDIGEVTARLLRAYTDEQAFGGEYIFEIDNADESLNTKDYNGREISLTWGFVGGTASVFPPLWVDHMEYVSKEGRLLLVLHCIDNWGLLAQINSGMWNQRWNFPEDEWDATAGMCLPESQTAVPTSVRTALDAQTDKTILQVITNIIYYAVSRAVVCDTTDFDGIINVEKPPIVVPDARSGVIRALQSTKCYLKWVKESGVGRYRVWKPDAHATAYTFNVSNLFFSNVYGAGLAIPNKIYYWAINTAGTDWVSGSAEDTTSSGRVGEIAEHYLYGDPYQKDIRASTTVLDNLASGVLDKVQSQRNQGELIAPMHCSLELFDKIRVIDDRYQGVGGGDDVTGYVHRIIREYDRGVYSIKVQLGGAVGGYTPSQGYPPTGMAKDPSDEVGRTTDPFVPEVDTTPPSDVVWETPAMTTGVILATEENQRDIVWVKGDWQAATDTGSGVAQYLVEWWTSETTDKHEQSYVKDHVAVIYDAKPNITYYMKVKAVDAQWNFSTNWSSTQSITSSKDTTAPTPPTPSCSGVVLGIRVTWASCTAVDFDEYILYRNTVNLSGTSQEVWRGRSREYIDRNCNYGQNYYYWLKAVDTSGNVSGFSAGCGPCQKGQATAVDITNDSLTIELMKPGLKPYSSTLTFLPWTTSPHDSVQWATGQIDYADGGSWGIYASNFQYIGSASCPCGNGPGCSGQMHYIYFTSTSHYLSITNVMENAFSDTKGLLAQVYVSQVENDADIGIITYKAKGDNIVVDFLAVKMLSSIAANIGTITAGTIIGTLIKTAGSGARVQLDGASATKTLQLINSSEQVRFELKDDGTWYGGNPTGQRIQWNGSTLSIYGAVHIGSGSDGYGNLGGIPDELADINTTEGSKLTGIESGADVTGNHQGDISLANLGEKNTSSLNQISGYKLLSVNQESGANSAYSGLDTNGYVKKTLRGINLPDTSDLEDGLNMHKYHMGFYIKSTDFWPVRIFSDGGVGKFFAGKSDLSNYILWDGTDLTVKGTIYACNIYGANTIVSGGSLVVSGKFTIDTTGINVLGDSLIFKDTGGNIRGHIFASADGLYIRNYGSVPIIISMQNSQWFKIAGHTQPSLDNTYYLGDDGSRFKYFHLYASYQTTTIGNGVDYKCTDTANGAHMLGTWGRYSDTSGDYWLDTDLRRRWNSSREFYLKNTSGGDRSTAWMLSA